MSGVLSSYHEVPLIHILGNILLFLRLHHEESRDDKTRYEEVSFKKIFYCIRFKGIGRKA